MSTQDTPEKAAQATGPRAGTLDDFLALPDIKSLHDTVAIPRLGVTVTVEAMTDTEFREYQQRARITLKRGKIDFDFGKFNMLIVSNHIVDPNFADAAFLKKAGFTTAAEFIKTKFTPGEISDIYEAISQLSGFDKDMDELVEEAKNS